ncbi:MAG: prolipoprotein diacylglyceryl transferase, partial [Desulfovibrio sp.]|nr:prolipoprotein diacylglyceryl transferase [Desulfovibrio sp.]
MNTAPPEGGRSCARARADVGNTAELHRACAGGIARRDGLMYIRRMLQFPRIAPEIVSIGPLAVRWYGAMYVLAFAAAVLLGRLRAARGGAFTRAQFDDVIIFGFLGVLLGARLGYALFYNPAYYFRHPSEILLIWKGGMSFHG